MAIPPALPPSVAAELANLGPTTLLVGIPSFNNVTTIGGVVHAVREGLRRFGSQAKAVLVVADGGSTDGTMEQLLALGVHGTIPLVPARYLGLPGKGSAVRALLEAAARVDARAMALMDADLRSVRAGWVHALLTPILSREFDYACPLYVRHPTDGTITNAIAYPMVRAIYGRHIRQPIGGEFGISSRLVGHLLALDTWDADVARFGIDIWMTTSALAGGFATCQVHLGAKRHDARDPSSDLMPMLGQVTCTLFRQVTRHGAHGHGAGSRPVPSLGHAGGDAPDEVVVDVARAAQRFRAGLAAHTEAYNSVLPTTTFSALRAAARQPDDQLTLSPAVWADVLGGLLLAHAGGRLPITRVPNLLAPLYLGWTASWLQQTRGQAAEAAEATLEPFCQALDARMAELLGRSPPTTGTRHG